MKKPDKYNGKSLHALKEYVRKGEIVFRLAPDRYSQDSTKVLYVIQSLMGKPRMRLCASRISKDRIGFRGTSIRLSYAISYKTLSHVPRRWDDGTTKQCNVRVRL